MLLPAVKVESVDEAVNKINAKADEDVTLDAMVDMMMITGCTAIVESHSLTYVPSPELLDTRRDISKRVFKKRPYCHSLLVRMGCYLSVFRKKPQKYGKLRESGYVMGDMTVDGWWIHPDGFIAKWGTDEEPQDKLPLECGSDTWPMYRERLLLWIGDTVTNTMSMPMEMEEEDA